MGVPLWSTTVNRMAVLVRRVDVTAVQASPPGGTRWREIDRRVDPDVDLARLRLDLEALIDGRTSVDLASCESVTTGGRRPVELRRALRAFERDRCRSYPRC